MATCRPASSEPGLAPGQIAPEPPYPSCSFLALGTVPLAQEGNPWVWGCAVASCPISARLAWPQGHQWVLGNPPQLCQHQNQTQRPGSESREQWAEPSKPGHLCHEARAGLDGTRASQCPAGWPVTLGHYTCPDWISLPLKVLARGDSTQLHSWTRDSGAPGSQGEAPRYPVLRGAQAPPEEPRPEQPGSGTPQPKGKAAGGRRAFLRVLRLQRAVVHEVPTAGRRREAQP